MSIISSYKEPKDLLEKLVREGQRTWRSQQLDHKCDHFFNFCVTAHALRDWCIDYLRLAGSDKDSFHKEMNTLKYLAECRDIANSSKHFSLSKPSLVSSATPTVTKFAKMLPGGVVNEGEEAEGLNLSLLFADGTEVDLFLFLHETASTWINVLARKGIPSVPGDQNMIVLYMMAELDGQ
jgi:hypothetical protein